MLNRKRSFRSMAEPVKLSYGTEPVPFDKQKGCPACKTLRIALICCLCGTLAGSLALILELGTQTSMAATFFGAFLPFFRYLRRNHDA